MSQGIGIDLSQRFHEKVVAPGSQALPLKIWCYRHKTHDGPSTPATDRDVRFRGFTGVGGAGGLDIGPSPIGKVGEMSWRRILADERGEGAIARHLRRGNITPTPRDERRR